MGNGYSQGEESNGTDRFMERDAVPTRTEQQASLDDTLLLLNRVVHAAVTSIVVTDPHLPDNPIVYHNPAFERLSGYSPAEIDGHNCRFLQGDGTDREVIRQLRDAIATERPFHGLLLNYRKNGTSFWNELNVSPVHDDTGRLTHFVGVQTDVTRRAEAEKERDALLTQQQRIADTLQRALLLTPTANNLNGLEISTQYEAAWDEANFGGDFYDSVALSETRIALVVGDCTGKGLKAAQYTAEVKYALRVLLREYGHPTPALHRLNTFLMDGQRLDARDAEALVCVAVAVVDTHTGETVIAGGGMEPPLIVRADGATEAVETSGLILGIDTAAEFTAKSVTLGEGDVIVMATDGVTEARGSRPKRDLFGYDGLIAAVTEALTAASAVSVEDKAPDLADVGGRVVDAVKAFAADNKPQDDVCLLIARRSTAVTVLPDSMAIGTGDGLRDDATPSYPSVSGGQTEATVYANGDLAQFALEVTGLGYWELDLATGAGRRSIRHDAIFGYGGGAGLAPPPPDWTYQRFLSHVHPEDRARVDAIYGRALSAGTDWQFECRVVRAGDAAVRWVESRGRHFGGASGAAGAAARIIGTVADITADKAARDAVERAERQLRLVTNAAPLLISYVDRDLTYRFVNKGYSEWFGRTAEQTIGRTVREVIGLAAFEASRARFEAVLSGGHVTYEAVMPYDEGRSSRYVHADMIPDIGDGGEVRGYVAVVADITARHEAEEKARERGEQVVTIFESMSDAFVALDSDWRLTYVNAEAERLLLRTRGDLLGKVFWDEFPATVDSAFGRGYHRAVSEGVVVTVEEFYPPLDGWFEVRAFPSPAGGLSIYFRDVTERKKAEEALRESEGRFRALADNIPQLAWMTDGEGWIFWYNQRWFDYTGTTLEQMRGWGWKAVHHPDHVDRVVDKFATHISAGEPWEDTFPLRRADGVYRWFLSRASPVRDEAGNIVRWFGTNTDITEEREARAAREVLLAQMDAILTSATDGIIVSDPAGNVLMWNPAGLAMHGYKDLAEAKRHLSEFPDTFALRLSEGDDSLPVSAWPLSRVMRGETFTDYEILLERLDTGTKWWASYSGSRALGGDGDPLLLVLTVRNISERRRMEAQRAALTQQLREAAEGQRRFLKEMLFGLTEGHMRLCDTRGDLPAELPPACDPVELTASTLRVLRKQVESVTEELRFAKERIHDLETAASEAAMNAVRHGGGGVARVHADPTAGVIQIWIQDAGEGIAEHLIHRAVESGWTTGGFGQGFFLMWRTCDRLYLLTGPSGTTVVLEQKRVAPPPSWLTGGELPDLVAAPDGAR